MNRNLNHRFGRDLLMIVDKNLFTPSKMSQSQTLAPANFILFFSNELLSTLIIWLLLRKDRREILRSKAAIRSGESVGFACILIIGLELSRMKCAKNEFESLFGTH